MKTLLHLFTRYRLASSFNLFGLILAFAGCYVLLTQIKFIGSFNHGIKDYENIHRVYIYGIMEEGTWNSTCSRLLADNLQNCPQVESAGYMRSTEEVRFDKNGSEVISPAFMMSDDMLTTINAELVDGTLDEAKLQTGASSSLHPWPKRILAPPWWQARR